MFYDALLLLGLLFVAAIPVTVMFRITYESDSYPLFVLYCLLVSAAFVGWFWTHGGQTLGLKTWHLELVGPDASAITWPLALTRFVLALLPWIPLLVAGTFKLQPETRIGQIALWLPPLLAWATALSNRNRVTWYDHFSGTRLISTPNERPDAEPSHR